MSKKVVILHGSPRVSGNSDILANEFKKGVEEAGNEAKKISFPMKFINYCKGCLGCMSSGECVIHDDMSKILEDLVNADVIVFSSPIYFNTITGQMKTIIDRLTPKAKQLNDKDYYFLFSAACDNQELLNPAVHELRGFLNCIGVESEKGMVFGLNSESEGEINHNKDALNQAFEFGKNI
ncbi:flavodoxin family protein [uncultured Methanobrevibacter sp.]|uniref:flavodoxin family protein n=1 Tax=uncultured Methanobrevibacter sp. TaxID=253161 RepID=UPI00261D8F3A|nr:flavodoxin family protein [uncultured Methanobrevibacter sp.]